MPPRKKAKASATTSATATSVDAPPRRASTRLKASPQSQLDSTASPEKKRKRPHVIDLDRDSSAEMTPPRATRASRQAPGGREAPIEKPPTKTVSRETWFQTYANPETGCIDADGLQKWMDDLQVHAESVFPFLVLYRCHASTTMTITEAEFLNMMEAFGVTSNKTLIAKLPQLMNSVKPTRKKIRNPEFKSFYMWCFNHFRVQPAKNIQVEYATLLFQTLLDSARYSPKWTPETSKQRTSDLSHTRAFVEFLSSEPRPVAVITRDQYEQFYEFDLTIPWNLEGYSEESAWPALFDNYATWKRIKYPCLEEDVQLLDTDSDSD